MIRIVTDSSSQIPGALVERYGVEVAPIVVTVDGTDYREGVDLDADAFYGFWRHGTAPEVSTSQPSPGDFIERYRRLASEGADSILSIHVGADYSGTLNSARVAAAEVDVPVRLVDTGTMSFGVSCCVWEAGEAIERGASVEEAARLAEGLGATLGSVTILQADEFARKQGRVTGHLPDDADGIAVFRIVGDVTEVIGSGRSIDELARTMVDAMSNDGHPIRVALCIADATARPFYEAMEHLLAARDDVVDLVRYRVGPSVGAYTGPGAAGGFWYPVQS